MPFRFSRSPRQPPGKSTAAIQKLFLLILWGAIYLASLASPPVLDDADATHAQAAAAMLRTGDWVTLHVNGVRYLEKAPLPYWIAALSLRLFGANGFAVHLPLALTVLGLATLGWIWGNQAFGKPTTGGALRTGNAGFYSALFTLTAAGVFLFTRIFIPDALLALLLAFALYASLQALEADDGRARRWAWAAWGALAAAVLTKGLVALVFLVGAVAIYLPLSGEARRWRRLHPATGAGLFLALAAPWHVLAGLRNRGGAHGHGFFWFYFVNEHVLRFLGRRIPADYNKLPAALYWSLHLVWLFPWSFFFPVAALVGWRERRRWLPGRGRQGDRTFGQRSVLLLVVFCALVLVFFSISTNQEYYTFPVYLPLLLLTAAALTRAESEIAEEPQGRRLVLLCQGSLAAAGLLAAAAVGFGLWSSRNLPFAPDIGDLLAHRGVGSYTLSMSHFFDLTTASFAGLRLPAALACAALGLGPVLSLLLRLNRRPTAAIVTLGLTSTAFLIAAHLALVRFAPLLSSRDFATLIQQMKQNGAVEPDPEILLYGDQAFGSSIPFYLHRPVKLVDGRSTSMLFGSTFPDVPPVFMTHQQLQQVWAHGRRKLLFVPLDRRGDVDRLLGSRALLLYENAGKALYTDRPLRRVDISPPGPEE